MSSDPLGGVVNDPRGRHDLPGPDDPIRNRPVTSPAILCERVRAVGRALREADESAARFELRQLADEALLLARIEPLIPTARSNRLRVAAEADGLGRFA
jgi:hypothetical protein